MSAPPGPLQELYEKQHPETSHWNLNEPCPDQAAKTDITEIAIERTGCYGFCSMYTLILRADGTAEYRGYANVKNIGVHHGSIDSQSFQELAQLADDIGYFTVFADHYDCPVTDQSTVFVSVSKAGRPKVIRHYAAEMNSGPPRLWWFEQWIDLVGDHIKWN